MNPKEAYHYAITNDGSDKLRDLCCKDSKYAYLYAIDIDESPREDTRIAACKDPYEAYRYARDVDKGYDRKTRMACYRNQYLYKLYLKYISKSNYFDELNLMPYVKRISYGH